MIAYRRVASPLHAARASAGGAYCVVLGGAALVTEHPLLLGALLLAVCAAGALAGVTGDLVRAARLAVPLALLVAAINPLVVREGLTVFARLGELGPLGQVDLTLEALAYGGLLGLRVIVVVLAFALFTAAVDPDEVLRLFGRVSLRSALTAALATRLVPVLARDGRRLADAQRCRADGGAGRLGVLRAVATGALDRAVDVAATLEVRGYGARARAARSRRPWSRHDLAFAVAATAVLVLVAGGRLLGVGSLEAYPSLDVPFGAAESIAAAALVSVALVPFAERRGIER